MCCSHKHTIHRRTLPVCPDTAVPTRQHKVWIFLSSMSCGPPSLKLYLSTNQYFTATEGGDDFTTPPPFYGLKLSPSLTALLFPNTISFILLVKHCGVSSNNRELFPVRLKAVGTTAAVIAQMTCLLVTQQSMWANGEITSCERWKIKVSKCV